MLRHKVYCIFDLVLFILTILADMLVIDLLQIERDSGFYFALSGVLLSVAISFPALMHELGHLLFGLFAGMKLARFRFSPFSRSATRGETQMFPKNSSHVRGKFIAFAFGGAAFNLLVGGALYAIYFYLPYHPALLFLALLAPFMIYEGLRALLPATLYAGKTDGGVILGLLKRSPEEEISLRVLTTQGILYRGTFQDVPRELLYDLPVVREDLPAFILLLFIRLEYELCLGDENVSNTLERLNDLDEYLTQNMRVEISSLMGEGAEITPESIKKEPLFGVRDLKTKLALKFKKT